MTQFATISERSGQVVLSTPVYGAQLLAKFPLHEQHSQNNEHVNHTPVYLEAESKKAFHVGYFLRPPVACGFGGLVALSATCAQREPNRAPRTIANQYHSSKEANSSLQDSEQL